MDDELAFITADFSNPEGRARGYRILFELLPLQIVGWLLLTRFCSSINMDDQDYRNLIRYNATIASWAIGGSRPLENRDTVKCQNSR